MSWDSHHTTIYTVFCCPFFPISDLWMWGITPKRQKDTQINVGQTKIQIWKPEMSWEFKKHLPPPAIVALMRESSSSSPLMASCKWRGVILFTFRSFDAFPANSSTLIQNKQVSHTTEAESFVFLISPLLKAKLTSAVKYSRIAALYTAAVAPTRPWLVVLDFRCLWIRPTGNWNKHKPI